MRFTHHVRNAALAVTSASLLLAGTADIARSQNGAPDYKNAALPVERRVADLLSRMTVDEKVAQTHALWQQQATIVDEQGIFSPTKAATVLRHGMGQIARPSEKRVPGGAAAGSAAVNRGPRESAEFVNAVQRWVVENTRLGIPIMFHEEALHGLAAERATSFPQAIALGGTFNPALVERVYGVAALETRARGAQQVLTPVLDLARDPRWGRTEETYGEDPYLTTKIGLAAIRGFQGDGPSIDNRHVFATAKHYAAHGQPEGGTNVAPANYSERVLREYWLEPFRAAVEEGHVMSVMASYNEIDGVPSHASTWLLDDVLRKEWGFRGFIVSDYFAIEQLVSIHRVAADKQDAARQALHAGVDLELPDIDAYKDLADQIRAGRIPEAELDRTVARILRAKFLAGLFENPYADPAEAERVTNTPEHQALALEAARQSIALLQNRNNLLPLDRTKVKSIAVIGPNAERVHLGGYSNDPKRGVSILQGIRDKVGATAKVVHSEGVRLTESEPNWYADEVILGDPALNAKRIEEAVKVARGADVVLLVLGENESTGREGWADNHLGDRDSLEPLGQQNDLVRAIAALNKPMVALMLGSRPLAMTYIVETVPAIFQGWYLGQEGGTAFADVLFGDYNPAARLPVTIPRSVGQVPAYYSQKPSARRGYLFANKDPLFTFGHGLSYTTFRYANVRVAPNRIGTGGTTTVSVDVTNTGSRAGDEVAQLYVRDLVSSVTRPVKELKGFERISLAPGETKTVTFTLKPRDLSFLDRNMHRVVEPGTFEVMVGGSSATTLSARFDVVNQ